ncbi:hypothetical protein [Embleya sp. NBC_00896]|uniref:hypothetical protein n=1 Tax=Embleya sp. NBC_00896 TaxID=2975961 RepID=UPI00386DBE58|nr:hypothetical protein OG928_23610 [Embleya sp. NBC_00896]
MTIGGVVFAVLFALYIWHLEHRRAWPVDRQRAAVAKALGRRRKRNIWLPRTGLTAPEVIEVAAEQGYLYLKTKNYSGQRRMTFVRTAPPGAFPPPASRRTTPGANGFGQ